MQTSLTNTQGLERRLEIAVPGTTISGEIEERLKRLSRTARLKGFRPGKAPMTVIRQQYGEQVRSEVLGDVMRKSFADAVRQENLKPAADPVIEPLSMDDGGDLKYAAVFEVLPEIALNVGPSITIERPAAEITDADLENMIESMRRQLRDRNAQASGAAEAPEGSGTADAPAATPVETPLPEVDQAFCEAYGIHEGGPEVLRAEVRKNMEREMNDLVRTRVRTQVLDALLRENPIDVPKALIDQQVQQMQLDTARRIGAKDISQLPPREHFEEPARRRVALGLIMSEILRKGEIKVDRTRLQTRLEEIVNSYPNPDEVRRAYLQSTDAMRQVESSVLEDQAFDWVLQQASVKDTPTTFRELTGFGGPAQSEAPHE